MFSVGNLSVIRMCNSWHTLLWLYSCTHFNGTAGGITADCVLNKIPPFRMAFKIVFIFRRGIYLH